MSDLGNLLRELRGKETLRDAASRIGVSHTYLSVLEKGYDQRSGKPIKLTADTLKLISKAYDYPYEELLKLAGILDENNVPYPSDKKDKPIQGLAFIDGGVEELDEEEMDYVLESLELYRRMKERKAKEREGK